MSVTLPLVSFKLRFHDARARALPAQDAAGCPFEGPGVDVMGDDARDVFALAAPLLAWFRAREPGMVARSLSVDLARGRFLLTIDDASRARPRVVRVDASHEDVATSALLSLVAPVAERLGELARDRLAARPFPR